MGHIGGSRLCQHWANTGPTLIATFLVAQISDFPCQSCGLPYVVCVEAEERKLREASLAASSRFKRALLHENEAKESLQKDLNAAQVRKSSRNVEDCGVAQKEPLFSEYSISFTFPNGAKASHFSMTRIIVRKCWRI